VLWFSMIKVFFQRNNSYVNSWFCLCFESTFPHCTILVFILGCMQPLWPLQNFMFIIIICMFYANFSTSINSFRLSNYPNVDWQFLLHGCHLLTFFSSLWPFRHILEDQSTMFENKDVFLRCFNLKNSRAFCNVSSLEMSFSFRATIV
jgi:hypothetical protein